jgi:hypothetical protein
MSETYEDNVLTTYRSLRVAMIPLLLILVVAPALETMRGQVCVLGSISAYFHTPVRGAFVFALAGLGACLIAYKGNDPVEDVLLNFAGFMAFLVALVPTTVDTTCGEVRECRRRHEHRRCGAQQRADPDPDVRRCHLSISTHTEAGSGGQKAQGLPARDAGPADPERGRQERLEARSNPGLIGAGYRDR